MIVFRHHIVLKLIDLRSSPKIPKNKVLEKSDPLTENFQNLFTKGFLRTFIHVFLSSNFAEIGKAEVTKRVRGIHHEEKVDILPIMYNITACAQISKYPPSAHTHALSRALLLSMTRCSVLCQAFCPLTVAFQRFRQNLQNHSFPTPIHLPSVVQIRFFVEIYPKMSSKTHNNIGVKPVGVSPTIVN